MVVRDRRLSATNSAGYNPNETRTGNNGSNTGRWNFRVQIEVWTGGSQRNVQPYTNRHGGVNLPPVRTFTWLARRVRIAGCVEDDGA
ncbi:hypothetical protein GCM10009764_87150 [Nocardia ninae]|uniref:Uncharacterized protein n=1 Tax=Nocardia ninae NBRC 108245 TaxID=1210091 RepID=A0A511MM58_9NOCA|nr:hypothetical protein NN4_62320 [Nocardia ninae NBRC 108245]